ncbi:MAG TPA: hypothetical protein VMB78_07475 [Dissulfurispiraceae bacterium]|nr:hypothetical protein [Dissulfurispiraceae bacterium]
MFFFLLMAIPSISFSGEIVVQPGKFDHFDLKLPQKLSAGEKVTVEVTAVDAFNNIIANFSDSRRDFIVSVSGSCAVTPSSLPSTSFIKGTAVISLRDTAAETFTLTILESGSTVPLQVRDIQVVPGKLSALVVRGPRAVPAGEKFDIKILAVDSFGNTVTDPIYGKNLNLLFKGGADPRIAGDLTDFRNGVGTVTLVSEKAGKFTIEVRDLITGGSGSSEWIEVVNSALSAFKIMVPKEIIAGEPFDVSIAAVDAFGNIVKNYSSVGSGVSITATGQARPFPSTISAYEFVNGQAKSTLRYDTTESAHDIALTITEINKKNTGTSDTIKVMPQIPTKYEVTNPESAVAGQKFRIKITAYNQIGNPIKNYNLIGPDVALNATGSGKLTPSRIPASEFVNGSALVDVQYNRSEAFTIMAEPIQPVRQVEKRAAEKAPLPEKEQVPVRKPEAEAKSRIMKTPAPAPQTQQMAKIGTLDITGISLVETQKKSVVTIHMPGLVAGAKIKFTARSIVIAGKKWVVVSITPAASKVVEPVKFDSATVGRIVIEDNPDNAGPILIKIENLKSAQFKVSRSDKSLIVTLAR